MSLKDKASRIKFPLGGVPASAPSVEASEAKTKTAPGAMMAFANDRRSDMLKENEELKKKVESVELIQSRLDETLGELRQWEGAKAVRSLDPQQIVRSKFANRHELNFEGSAFTLLKEEIASAGRNIQPIKVRPIKDTTGTVLYEIVFGHRRHEACRQLDIPVQAIVDNLDDQSLFVEMDRENRSRKDLSPWEQGVMYQKALNDGLFPTLRKLADALGVDAGNVSKAISLAELPEAFVQAFPSPLDLQHRWAKPLRDAFSLNPDACLAAAEKIRGLTTKPSAAEVYAALVAAGAPRITPTQQARPIHIAVGKTEIAKISLGKSGRTEVLFEVPLNEKKTQALADFIRQLMAS